MSRQSNLLYSQVQVWGNGQTVGNLTKVSESESADCHQVATKKNHPNIYMCFFRIWKMMSMIFGFIIFKI